MVDYFGFRRKLTDVDSASVLLDDPDSEKTFMQRAKDIILKQFLLIGLFMFLVIAVAFPLPGKVLHDEIPGIEICSGFIFFFAGLYLKTEEIKKALLSWKALVFGTLSILIIRPWIASAIVKIPAGAIPFDFIIGLAVWLNTPSSLFLSTILTQESHGNMSLSFLLTVIANFIGIFSVPYVIHLTLSVVHQDNAVDDFVFSPTGLLIMLVEVMMAPMILGKILRSSSLKLRKFLRKRKLEMRFLSNVALVLIPWMQVSASRDKLRTVTAGSFVLITLLAAAVHIFLLVYHKLFSTLFKMKRGAKKAVIFTGSGHELSAALVILTHFNDDETVSSAVMSIAMVLFFLVELIIDVLLCWWWTIQHEKAKYRDVDYTPGLDYARIAEANFVVMNPEKYADNSYHKYQYATVVVNDKGALN